MVLTKNGKYPKEEYGWGKMIINHKILWYVPYCSPALWGSPDPNTMPDRTSAYMSNRMPDRMPDRRSDRMSDRLSTGMPNRMAQ